MSDFRNASTSAQPANDAPGEAAPIDEAVDGAVRAIDVSALEAELADHKDKLLRALAETENVRRRGQREREDAQKFGLTNFARDLLSTADNLRRALESVPEAEIKDDRMRNLLEGVAATERELLSVLERNGVKRIDAKGEKFDHNLHQAIYEVEKSGQPGGTVIEVLQPGYTLNERLLRPAMVGVAKGEAKTAGTADRVDTTA